MGSFSRWVKLPFSPASVLFGSFHAVTGPTIDRPQASQKNTLRSVSQKIGLVRFLVSLLCLRSRPSCSVVDLKPKLAGHIRDCAYYGVADRSPFSLFPFPFPSFPFLSAHPLFPAVCLARSLGYYYIYTNPSALLSPLTSFPRQGDSIKLPIL